MIIMWVLIPKWYGDPVDVMPQLKGTELWSLQASFILLWHHIYLLAFLWYEVYLLLFLFLPKCTKVPPHFPFAILAPVAGDAKSSLGVKRKPTVATPCPTTPIHSHPLKYMLIGGFFPLWWFFEGPCGQTTVVLSILISSLTCLITENRPLSWAVFCCLI